MSTYAGNVYVPVLAHNPDGNYRARMTTWPLDLGTMIVSCLAHDQDPDIGNARIFEVYVAFIHVADAASLEAALAILSDKYQDEDSFARLHAHD